MNPTKRHLSTSKMAEKFNVSNHDLFDHFKKYGLIIRINEKWELTDKGIVAGGEIKKGTRFGDFIVWPDDLNILEIITTNDNKQKIIYTGKKISIFSISKHFKLSPKFMTSILFELGFIIDYKKGWRVTTIGINNGGTDREDNDTGISYTMWDQSICQNVILINEINFAIGKDKLQQSTDSNFSSFRQKFATKHRTIDGHYVRSIPDLIIDNWLYINGYNHSYNRRLPIANDVYADFYLPKEKLYIEFYGIEKSTKSYSDKEDEKFLIYKVNNLNVVKLTDKDLVNIDTVLSKLILKCSN